MNRRVPLLLSGIVVGMLSVCAGAAQEPGKVPARPAPEVIAAWEKAGAKFGWMAGIPGDSFWRPGWNDPKAGMLPGFYFTVLPSEKLASLPALKVPFGLWLHNTEVKDADLKQLSMLKQLQTLCLLEAVSVTDDGVKELAGLTELQALYLGATQVSDEGLKKLTGLKQLRTLNLGTTAVTDKGLKELAALKQLQSLDLSFTQVTEAGVKELAGLKHLQSLNLTYTSVSDEGMKELAALEQLTSLRWPKMII